MSTQIRDFSDIQRHASQLYKGQPLQLVVTPIKNKEILHALEEADASGWVEVTQVGEPSENKLPNLPALEEAVSSLAIGKGEVLLSHTLDPKPLLATLLRKDLGLRKETEVWSHVAVFEWQDPPRWLLVSDGVLVTRPDLARRIDVIKNAIKVAGRLGVKNPNVALLAASRAIQQDMQTSREWTWVSKMAERRIFHGARVCGPIGLEEAIQPAAPNERFPLPLGQVNCTGHNWADVLITADISVGNPLVSALTLLCGLPCAGLVVGGDVPVVFPWPTVDRNAILTSLALAALSSPRGLRRILGKWGDVQ